MKSLLTFLLCFLSCISCVGTGGQNPQTGQTLEAALKFLETFADVVVRMEGTEALKKYAPEALPLLDTNPPDGVITLAEIKYYAATVTTSPEVLTWTLIVVREILKKKH